MSTQFRDLSTDYHRFAEQAANGGTPDAGFGKLWFKDDGTPQATNDAGTDFDLSGSGSVTLTGVETLTNKTMDFASNTFQNTGLGELGRIAGSTYSTIQHLQDIFHSSGVSSGGGVTDDADGTITVAAGTGFIRATDSDVAEILFMDWAAESGANVALTDNDMNFLYVEYNSGSPQVIATISKRTDTNTNISLGTVYRLGTTLHITMNTRPIVRKGRTNRRVLTRAREAGFRWPGGRSGGRRAKLSGRNTLCDNDLQIQGIYRDGAVLSRCYSGSLAVVVFVLTEKQSMPLWARDCHEDRSQAFVFSTMNFSSIVFSKSTVFSKSSGSDRQGRRQRHSLWRCNKTSNTTLDEGVSVCRANVFFSVVRSMWATTSGVTTR